jgi:signal peptidase I, archaeal type
MRIKNIFSNVFLAFAVILLICAVIFVRTGDRNDHSRYFMNLKFYQTRTGSMEPHMKVNSVVIVKKANISELAAGDVVCFIRGGDAVAHRVIAVTENGLRTKGDNNSVDDAAIVLPDEVVGKCVLVMNWVAAFLKNLETPAGIMKVIVLPILFLVIVFLAFKYIKMVRLPKKKEPEKEPEE